MKRQRTRGGGAMASRGRAVLDAADAGEAARGVLRGLAVAARSARALPTAIFYARKLVRVRASARCCVRARVCVRVRCV